MYDFIFQDKASDNAANGSSNTNTPVPNKIGRHRRKRVSSDIGIQIWFRFVSYTHSYLTFIYCCSLLSKSFSLITHKLFVQSFVFIPFLYSKIFELTSYIFDS